MTGLFPIGTGEARPLREHQAKAVAMLRQALRAGSSRAVLAMPTGSGKTRTAAELIRGALGKGKRVAFTVPAISLVDQSVAAFEAEGIDAIGVVQAAHPRTDRRQPVQVVSVQSLARRVRPPADLVIVDECHLRHAAISEWMAACPEAVFVGLSATPWQRGMADDWQELVTPVRIGELIDAGLLSSFRVYAPSHPDMSGVAVRNGEFVEDGAAKVMGPLTADVVTTWQRHGVGLPTLVFAVNLAHAEQLVAEFAAAGIAMGFCHARTDLIERRALFRSMARGDLAGIVNVGTLTTGVDADVRCIVLARPTRSEILHVQIIGRGLRTAPGKERLVILDHADNHARLGFVTDIHHDRLKGGSERKAATAKERGEPMPKECGGCGALRPPKIRKCPSCGFEPQRQCDIEVEDGELVEMAPKSVKVDRTDKQRLWSELMGVAHQRGRSRGWAAHAYQERTGVWPRGLEDRPMMPSPETLAYVRSKDIRFAKRRVSA